MKHAEKNEVDLLLRALARRDRLAGKEDVIKGNHLDADELNAYAEDVLPSAARARYTAHIADCQHCRQLVSQLSLAAGSGAAVAQVSSEQTKLGFWAKLSSLLSPGVIRYATPVAVLLAVVAVGVFVMRQQPGQEMARRIATSSPAPVNQSEALTSGGLQEKSGDLAAPKSVAAAPPREGVVQPSPNAVQPATQDGDRDTQSRGQPSVAVPTDQINQSKKQGETVTVTSEPAYSPDVAAAAPPPQPAKPENRNEAVAQDRKQRENEEAQADEAKRQDASKTRAADKEAPTVASGRSISKSENVSRRREGAREEQALLAKGKNKDDYSSVRSVGGRSFRREGNTWIDTDFAAGRAVTNVKRGSEQYRALIADEPELKNIAEQLGGEVLVVWKGRAYRIH